MKKEATRKNLTDNFSKIYRIDYQYGFLPEPFAYNSGNLGWNWNAYNLGDICLIDGYRSFPKYKRLPESAKKIVDEYEQEVDGANLSERVNIDKKYLNKFIEVLSND